MSNESIHYQFAHIPPPSPPSIELASDFETASNKAPSNKSFHSLNSVNSATSRAHVQIASLSIKDRPLEQILTKPYGEILHQSDDDPSVVSYQVDSSVLKDAPRSFDRLGFQPWVPSLHSPIESNVSVTSGGTNASANSLAAITNAAVSGTEPSTIQVRTVSPTPFSGSVLTSPAVMFPPSLQTSYFNSSSRDRVSNLKVRTGSVSSSSGDSEKSKADVQRSNSNSSVTKLPHSSTISVSNNLPIEEEDSNSSGVSIKHSQPVPGNVSLSAASVSASASVLNGSNSNSASFFFDVAAPPLAFYRHVPRIFGTEPPYISGHTCTLVNNKLFIFGGRTPTGHSNKLYVFNCMTNLLTCPTLHGQIPPPLRDVSAILADDYHIYYFGGQDEAKFYNSLYVLDTRSFRFTKLTPEGKIPESRAGHSCALRKTTRFFDDNGTIGSTTSTNSSSKKPIVTSTIYIFGGASTSDQTFNDVWRLHISPTNPYDVAFSDLPATKDNWPSPRVNHTAHSYKDGMLVYGGNDSTNRVFKTLWLFDFASENWCTLNDSSRPRTLHMSELVDDQLIVIGGHDGEKCIVFVDIYNLKTGSWHSRLCNGMQSSGQCFHKGVYFDSRMFIVGGLDPIHILSGLRIIEMPNIKL